MTFEARCWRILAVSAVLLGLAIGAARATGAPSLADPNDYLAKHGLHAPLVPFHVVDLTETEGTPLHALGGPDFGWTAAAGTAVPVESCVLDDTPPSEMCPQGGRHEAPGVWVDGSLPALDRARVALHEWGHIVSFWAAWGEVYCEQAPAYCERPFVRWYEEGPVEAWTMAHLPGWWRALAGKPLRRATILSERAEPGYGEALRWLAAAERATGTSRWSRESREWLNGVLLMSLDERVAVLDG